MPSHLPIMLKLSGRRCVIVGGGPVALRRAQAMLDCDADVTVIAPQIDDALAALPDLIVHQRPYEPGDLADAVLVVVATDDPAVNDRVARDADERGVLVNRADDPAAGDVAIPAHAHHGPITLAVYTAGRSASAAATIRRSLSDQLDPDWPRLLEAVGLYREQIQARVADPAERHARLRRLTDADAMAILKAQGVDALHARCRAIVQN
ncbi:bifunctional precorrin-2 dehydrogenase/sirohydrochlorin ferrochelatase [Phycisphaerales bacterium AB-hyl4]|uniref:precorrin-2 dehydrogenase n=1 Tax=Natronomicrosphaera hydrolytica TaxID=3242702 RepID=A0ABV4U8K0_9BACT